jgi:hypothetical protein
MTHCISCFHYDACDTTGVCRNFGWDLKVPPRQQIYESTSPQKPKALDPGSDSWWLHEYQKLMTNVLGWVETGKSETAIRVMQEMQARWQNRK